MHTNTQIIATTEYKLFHYTYERIMTRFIIQVARIINQLSQMQQAPLINYHKFQIPTVVEINRFVANILYT